jgi:hypothetical protein
MHEKEGLIIFFDEERRSDLIKERAEGGYGSFSDALSVHDWDVKHTSLALLAFSSDTIDYICIASKGNQIVTSKSRVSFFEIVNLDQIKIAEIESRLKSDVRNYFIRSTQGHGGRIPKKTWHSVLDVIAVLRPKMAIEIERLKSIGKFSGYKLYGAAAEVLMQEREALGISLEIFTGNNKLRDAVLDTWAPAENSVKDINEDSKEGNLVVPDTTKSSFLRGISSRYFQEESTLQHDLFNWDGMTPCHESGVSVFQSGQRKLEVIYANKNDLEKTLGVDLIYYNSKYKSFILLQYKLMKEDSNGDEFCFRPDDQLRIELKRMDDFVKLHPPSMMVEHEDYRLCSDGFLLKLVPNRGLQPASGELIKGMYLTKSYVDFLLGENGPKGERGGQLLTFKNSPRYLTNIEFAQMVNRGWIGTAGATSDILNKLIREFYETGRALMVAHEISIG